MAPSPASGLRLYNTLTRTKEDFRPIDPAHVRLYVCGPTVYDHAHIGNARPVIVFDVLFRLLRQLYGADHVTYARNITDVDDKINARAAQDFPDLPLNEAIRRVTATTEAQFHADVAALGCLAPNEEPRATEHIPQMRALIERLVARGVAYVAEAHVLFAVAAMERLAGVPRYGALARRSLDEMLAGARVDVAPYKRDAMDFVLWKPSEAHEPGWPSPCGIAGLGRPGWHIECSAMSMAKLLEPFGGGLACDNPSRNVFDIHGGGIDLVFPHHENEVAQSCCAFGSPRMANFWLHNGFLQVEGEKMSKSLGNFVTINELLRDWTGSVIRFAMLQTHYRQPINWTMARLVEAREEIGQWAADFIGSEAEIDFHRRKLTGIRPLPSRDLLEALKDDLNTPNAISVLRKQYSSNSSSSELTKEFFQNCEFLGLVNGDKVAALESGVSGTANKYLFDDAWPIVVRLRAAIANSDDERKLLERKNLIELGLDVKIGEDASIELIPLRQEDALDQAKIERLLTKRTAARAAKNWAESDRLRYELLAMGIALKDNKDGTTTWEVKR